MLEKNKIGEYLKKCLETGADFSEIFLETTSKNNIIMNDSKIDKVTTSIINGIGIRICQGVKKVYGYTNKLDDENILELIEKLTQSFEGEINKNEVELNELESFKDKIKIPHEKYLETDKKKILLKIDEIARSKSNYVNQVYASLVENHQKVTIANSEGIYREDDRIFTGLSIDVYVKSDDLKEKSSLRKCFKTGYEFLENINLETEIDKLVTSAIAKLDAKECPSGTMPVIIGNGFGGVIFHEACGHSLEATTVAKETSVFTNMLETKIANSKVTLKDNALIPEMWGSNNIDDEGNLCQNTTLIENGVLKNYLIDKINNRTMKLNLTSSGRRESYKFSPTSRMSNTYLEKGNDKIEDMIKSIEYGIYAKEMGGGSVNTITGEFNFSVTEAYLIEKGKITDMVKGASLIGSGQEVIKNVSMVGEDLELSPGWCGSISGDIPVTVGIPTIKVDNILVGGKGEKINEL